jgi:hypothetical protein
VADRQVAFNSFLDRLHYEKLLYVVEANQRSWPVYRHVRRKFVKGTYFKLKTFSGIRVIVLVELLII